MPALTLNYFGQGALLLERPEAVKNPFYLMAPDWALVPLVVLATAATVIASQALITGAFSVTKQVIQLGYLPRLNIQHTSVRDTGPDLHPVRQLGPVRGDRAGGGDVPLVEQPGGGLRHRGDAGHADHHHADLLRDPLRAGSTRCALCIAATGCVLRGRPRCSSPPTCSSCSHGGWFPLLIGGVHLHADDDLEGRPRHPEREAARRRDRPAELPGVGVRQPADARGRHGGVPHRRAGHGAQRAAAQPQAQQGAARAQPVRHRAQPRGAVDRHGQAPARSSRWATTAGR